MQSGSGHSGRGPGLQVSGRLLCPTELPLHPGLASCLPLPLPCITVTQVSRVGVAGLAIFLLGEVLKRGA